LADKEFITIDGSTWSLTLKGSEKAINLYNRQENLYE
jgi:manganese/zinc/iron transport system permease protein